MECEAAERENESGYESASDYEDPFIAEGLSSSSDSDTRTPLFSRGSAARLSSAKACREKLKQRLFRAKERRSARAVTHRAALYDSAAED